MQHTHATVARKRDLNQGIVLHTGRQAHGQAEGGGPVSQIWPRSAVRGPIKYSASNDFGRRQLQISGRLMNLENYTFCEHLPFVYFMRQTEAALST